MFSTIRSWFPMGKKSCARNIIAYTLRTSEKNPHVLVISPPLRGQTFQNLGGLEIFQLETPYLHAVEMAMNNFCAIS